MCVSVKMLSLVTVIAAIEMYTIQFELMNRKSPISISFISIFFCFCLN